MCHKKSSRLVSVILCILIFSFCLCSDAFIATAIEINEDGKPVCVATIDDSFSLNEIILVIMPNYASKNYTTSDFSDVNCTNIEELIWNNANSSYNRVIKLTIQSSSKSDVIAAIRVLEQRTDIYSADPNYFDIVQVADNNDAYTTNAQWSMNNISLPEVLDCSFSSEEIYVGVIDTGINVANPTLNALVDTTLSLSFSPDYTIGTQDLQGHGTHVAGIIGAQVTNTVDKNEMYPNVKIVSLRVGGSSGQIYLWGVLSALNYAEACGIQILNFSAGGVFPLPITIALETAINNFSGLFVCSAGNNQANNDLHEHYPSNCDLPNILAVGASTPDDIPASFSNYGQTTVDIFAPGENILSCFPAHLCEAGTCQLIIGAAYSHYSYGYHIMSGTSMAAPHVAGVAALLLSIHPELTTTELKQIIMDNVDIIYDENLDSVFEDLCVSGGRLNAYKALSDPSIHNFGLFVKANSTYHKRTCTTCGYIEYGMHKDSTHPGTGKCMLCGYFGSSTMSGGSEDILFIDLPATPDRLQCA